jgi:hypothetical protein
LSPTSFSPSAFQQSNGKKWRAQQAAPQSPSISAQDALATGVTDVLAGLGFSFNPAVAEAGSTRVSAPRSPPSTAQLQNNWGVVRNHVIAALPPLSLPQQQQWLQQQQPQQQLQQQWLQQQQQQHQQWLQQQQLQQQLQQQWLQQQQQQQQQQWLQQQQPQQSRQQQHMQQQWLQQQVVKRRLTPPSPRGFPRSPACAPQPPLKQPFQQMQMPQPPLKQPFQQMPQPPRGVTPPSPRAAAQAAAALLASNSVHRRLSPPSPQQWALMDLLGTSNNATPAPLPNHNLSSSSRSPPKTYVHSAAIGTSI